MRVSGEAVLLSGECDQFVWRCPAVLLYSVGEGAVESPRFKGGKDLSGTEWTFSFYPRGDESPEHVSLFMKRAEDDKGPIHFHGHYSLCIVDAEGRDVFVSAPCRHTFVQGGAHGMRKMAAIGALLQDPHTLMPGREITFKCRIRRTHPTKKQPSVSKLRTRISVQDIDYMWLVENIRQLSEANKAVLPVQTSCQQNFLTLSCYPSPGGQLKICFEIGEMKQPTYFARARVSILDKHMKVRVTRDGEHLFTKKGELWMFPDTIESQKLMGGDEFLVDGALNMKCHIRIANGSHYSCCEATLTPLNESSSEGTSLAEDVTKQADAVLFPDVRIRVEGENFFAHKSLLAARSSTFKDMLQTRGETSEVDCAGLQSAAELETSSKTTSDTKEMVVVEETGNAVGRSEGSVEEEPVGEDVVTGTTHDIVKDGGEGQAEEGGMEIEKEPSQSSTGDTSNERPAGEQDLEIKMDSSPTEKSSEQIEEKSCTDEARDFSPGTEKEDVLVLEDTDKNTFKIVLKFLYTDSIGKLKGFDTVSKLYAAAVKYNIPLLKTKCLSKFKSTIKVDNVVKVLILAKEASDSNLWSSAMKFLLEHIDVLKDNREWEELETKNKKVFESVTNCISLKTKTETDYWMTKTIIVETGRED